MTIPARLASIFCLSLITGSAVAADYYVSPGGNDAGAGTFADPWATVQHSIDQMGPGDALSLMPGVYYEKIAFHVSGQPGSYISIAPYDPSLPTEINGQGNTSQTAMVAIVDQSYIAINNITIANNVMNDAQGILIEGNCQGIQLRNLTIHDIHFSADPFEAADPTKNAQGIIVYGSDPANAITGLIIEGNWLSNCRLGYSEGIAVNGNVEGFSIKRNNVYELTNIGIVAIGHEGVCSVPALDQARSGVIEENYVYDCHSPYAYCAGIYIDGAKDTKVLRNSCRFNDYGIEVGCEHPGKSASGITVRNNLIYRNSYAGLAFGGYDYPGMSGKIESCTVYNNTFWQNDSLYDGFGDLAISYAELCWVENNIFYTNQQLRAVSFEDPATTTVSMNYNLYFTPDNDQSNLVGTAAGELTLADFQLSGQEANGFYDDPQLYLDGSDYGFWLTDINSPCIDAGNPGYVLLPDERDFFNLERIWMGGPLPVVDIGASEFIMEGIGEQTEMTFVVYPNPANTALTIVSDEKWERIDVLGLSGNTVLSQAWSAGLLDVSQLKPGAYIVRCSNASKVGHAAFVKE